MLCYIFSPIHIYRCIFTRKTEQKRRSPQRNEQQQQNSIKLKERTNNNNKEIKIQWANNNNINTSRAHIKARKNSPHGIDYSLKPARPHTMIFFLLFLLSFNTQKNIKSAFMLFIFIRIDIYYFIYSWWSEITIIF